MRLALLAALSVAAATAGRRLTSELPYTALDGEVCSDGATAADQKCAATQDFILLLDASSSVASVHAQISQFASDFVELFGLAAEDASPRIGIILLAGTNTDADPRDGAQVLVPPTSDRQVLLDAIASRPNSSGLTCISVRRSALECEACLGGVRSGCGAGGAPARVRAAALRVELVCVRNCGSAGSSWRAKCCRVWLGRVHLATSCC